MCLYPTKITRAFCDTIEVSCGKCLECLSRKSIEWAVRICLEAREHAENCFITLTYAETDYNLHKRDLQLFIKRLRKHVEPVKVRYFACGEYGSKGHRPHYHIILFGWKPKDGYFWRMSKGEKLYRSPTLEKLWSKKIYDVKKKKYVDVSMGFSTWGDISFNSARYCAKYLQKLNEHIEGRTEPFVVMSNRPGIGFNAISPDMLLTDKVYYDGKSIRVPRYFEKVLEREGYSLENLRDIRQKHMEFYQSQPSNKKKCKERRERLLKKFGKIFQGY